MRKTKLVCFDLDDTLINTVHSVMLPCILNGKEKEHSVIQEREEAGELDCISADYLRAKLLNGLEENEIARSFLKIARPIKNMKHVVDALHRENILCIVVTVGPKQVAKVVSDIWGFDGYYGSDYEVANGVFTGKIRAYIRAEGKVECLLDFCDRNGIAPSECVAVGDGATDIPIFKLCGMSIALNASPEARREASCAVDTQDLSDILPHIA